MNKGVRPFQSQPAPDEALRALARLIALSLRDHGAAPTNSPKAASSHTPRTTRCRGTKTN